RAEDSLRPRRQHRVRLLAAEDRREEADLLHEAVEGRRRRVVALRVAAQPDRLVQAWALDLRAARPLRFRRSGGDQRDRPEQQDETLHGCPFVAVSASTRRSAPGFPTRTRAPASQAGRRARAPPAAAATSSSDPSAASA